MASALLGLTVMRDGVARSGLSREPTVALAQGAFYVASGLWPLVSMASFERVTGPKVDRWLVKTVGVLIAVIGAVLLFGGTRRRVGREVPMLAAGSAAALAGVDIVYSARGRISPVYLLDAAVEAGLALVWAPALLRTLRAPYATALGTNGRSR